MKAADRQLGQKNGRKQQPSTEKLEVQEEAMRRK